MEPGLITGDNILVWKPTVGPRIFNLFASMRNEQTEIYRIPGFKRIKRNDILVFNFPHPNSWDKIEMHILKYYIKRCVGIPGDTLSIRNGFFHVEGVQTPLGNMDSQKGIAATEKFQDGIFRSFPFDSIIGWNIKDFGPLYIPAKGDSVTLDHTNFRLYKKLIEWEQQGNLQYKNSTVLLNGTPGDRKRRHRRKPASDGPEGRRGEPHLHGDAGRSKHGNLRDSDPGQRTACSRKRTVYRCDGT